MNKSQYIVCFICLLYGSILCAQKEGYYWYKFNYTPKMISEGVLDFEIDHLGYVWVMTSSNLYFLDEQAFSNVANFYSPDSNYIQFEKINGSLITKTKTGSIPIYKEDQNNPSFTSKSNTNSLSKHWQITINNGKYHLTNEDSDKLEIAPEFQKLQNPIQLDTTSKIIADDQGGLWINGNNGILFYKKEDRIFKAQTQPNIVKQITAIYTDERNDQIIYLTSFAIKIVDTKTGLVVEDIVIPEPYNRLPTYDWFFVKEKVFVWAGFGLFEFDLVTHQLDLIFDPRNVRGQGINQLFCSYVSLSPDSTYLTIGTKGNNFYTYELSTKRLTTYEIIEGLDDNSNMLFEMDYLRSDGSIFVTQDGIYLFEKEEGKVSNMSSLYDKLKRSGAENIQDLEVVQEDILYFTTRTKGMYFYDMQKDSIYQPINNLKNVLKLTNFVVDDQGDAWCGSSKGILHYRKKTNRLHLYDTKNGLFTDDFLTNICHFTNGDVFFGHGLKYIQFDPDEVRYRNISNLFIQGINVNGKYFGGIDPIFQNGRIKLDYDQNNLSLEIGGSNYGTTPQFQVEYRLMGLTDQWTLASQPEHIEFLSIQPGKYTFQYKQLGESDTTAYTLDIVIQRPFWMRTWVRSVAIGLGLLLLFGFYFYTIWTIKKRAKLEAEYEKKIAKIQMEALRARMNPHFIFNSLNSIKSFIIENDSRSATRYLTKFAHLIRQILNNSMTSKITLAEELKSLELYIQIEKLRFNDSFSYEILSPPDLDLEDYYIPSMILQPIVENAIWHGLLHKKGEKHIRITIEETDEFIVAKIEDNGVGRKRSEEMKSTTRIKDKSKSVGMDITSERIQLENKSDIKGGIEVVDLMDSNQLPCGTIVILKIPITYENETNG